MVEVNDLMDLSRLGGDVPLLYPDPLGKWTTMRDAWHGCGQSKFMTIWKSEMVRAQGGESSNSSSSSGPAGAQEVRLVKKRGNVPTMFGVAACTKENMEALANHPNASAACAAFMTVLRGGEGGVAGAPDLPPELSGDTGKELMRHLVDVGGPLLAAAQASFPQLKESRRASKRSSSAASHSGGSNNPKRTRTSSLLKAIGQTSSCSKIHNSNEQMGLRRAFASNKADADQAMATHSSERCDILLKVNTILKEAGVLTAEEVMKAPTPTVATLDQYVKSGGNKRILAWRQYRNIHGLQGQHVKYHFLFDFVYGGGENHATVLQNTRFNTIISDKSGVAKAPKNLTVNLPPPVSTISHI